MIIKKGPTPRILSVVGIGVLMSCGKVFCAKRGKLSNDLYLWSGTPGVSRLSPPRTLLNNDHRKLHPRFIVAWYVAGHLEFPEWGTLLESIIHAFRFASRNI